MLVDSTGTNGASLEDKFLFYVFAAFSITEMVIVKSISHIKPHPSTLPFSITERLYCLV